MKPNDLLHAMNDIDPKLIDQSLSGETTAEKAEMKADRNLSAAKYHPMMRIAGTVAGIAACAVIVAGGVLLMKQVNAQKPTVADATSVPTEQATLPETPGTTVSASAECENTYNMQDYSSTDGTQNREQTPARTDPADMSRTAPGTNTTVLLPLTGTASNPATDASGSPGTTAGTGEGTVRTEPNTTVAVPVSGAGFPCAVQPKIWKTSWYDEFAWDLRQPEAGGFVIHNTTEMLERNMTDACTYVYENCGFADDAFFAQYDLIVCAAQYGTGSVEVGVRSLEYVTAHDPFGSESSWVNLDLVDYLPAVQTCDECMVCIAIPVPKGLLPGDFRRVYTSVNHYQAVYHENGTFDDQYRLYQAALPEPLMITRAEALID